MAIHRYKNSREHCRFAKNLRQQSSISERMLWNALLSLKKETSLHFRRQHPLHPYIADFACVKARLIVELDCQSHDTRLAYDAKRETVLRNRGWTTIRFSNEDVLSNIESVVEKVLEKTRELLAKDLLPASGEDAKT
jgi:very-short-patch-repair endonuclease